MASNGNRRDGGAARPGFGVLAAGVFAAGVLAGGILPAHAQQIGSAALDVLVQQCAPCHGVDGIGHDTEIPNLAGQHDRYLWLQMMAFRKGTRKHQEMRYMSRVLSEDEIAALVQYYSGLPR